MEIQKNKAQLIIGNLQNPDEKIQSVLKYIFSLIGISERNLPSGSGKVVLINFIKKYLSNYTLEEIVHAYDFAVNGTINIDLKLYDGIYSPKNIVEVMNAYKIYINDQSKKNLPKEVQMNNIQRLAKIDDLLSEETKEKLKELGKEKEKPKPQYNRNYDIFQKWMALFDKLKRNFEVPQTNGRYIKRYGKVLNLENFIEYKTEQLQRVVAYIEERNEDLL